MKKYWILDNGHGGLINRVYMTNGKRSPVWPDGSQLFEGVFNREIVQRIKNLCDEAGICAHVLVPENLDIPLKDRVMRANQIYWKNKNAVLLSIHANAGGGSGYEIFTSKGETRSDKIASIFFKAMQNEFPEQKFRADFTDGDHDKESQFYILRKTQMPAVLSENFFMDNELDCRLLMSEKGKDRIAQAHFEAIKQIEINEKI